MIPNINISTISSESNLLDILEDLGHRPTNQRRQVLNVLKQKWEGFTVQEISQELPQLGRATIYRTIKLLLRSGMLCKLSLPNGAPRYVMARAEHHHHTVCVKCGTVGEFRNTSVERILRSLGSKIPGEIIGHRMEMYLICQGCSKG